MTEGGGKRRQIIIFSIIFLENKPFLVSQGFYLTCINIENLLFYINCIYLGTNNDKIQKKKGPFYFSFISLISGLKTLQGYIFLIKRG